MKNSKTLVCVETPSKLATPDDLECIYVSEFNDSALRAFHKSFIELSTDPDVTIIPIAISSYGGEVYSLLAMLDIMASTEKTICTMALGKAMSCGSVLLAAGTKGYRYMGRNADVMIHEVSSSAWGKTTEIKADVKETDRLNNMLLKKLSEYCGKPGNFFHKKLKERTNTDWYLSAKICKSFGLIDHIGIPNLLKK